MATIEHEEDDEQDMEIILILITALDSQREYYRNVIEMAASFVFPFVTHVCDKILVTGSLGDASYLLSATAGFPVDIDYMYSSRCAIALTNPQNLPMVTDPSVYAYSIVNAVNNPGYFHLKLIKEGSMFPMGFLSVSAGCYVQKDGHFLLSSRRLNELCFSVMDHPQMRGQLGRFEATQSVQGPALTMNTQNMAAFGFLKYMGMDRVIGVKCDDIPEIAKEFFTRSRGQWPPLHILEEVHINGCYLVPKGLKGSDKFEYEWCISFAHAEKMLVQNMDSIAFGVLGILKLLKHNVLKPKLGDRITSFMLKTSLFWTLEDTNYGSESDNSIFDIIRESLRHLLHWVADGFLPHFFVRDMNIIKNHFDTEDQQAIIACLRDIIQRIEQIVQSMFNALLSGKTVSDMLQMFSHLPTEKLGQDSDLFSQLQIDNVIDNVMSSLCGGSYLGFVCQNQTSISECLKQLHVFYDSNKNYLPLSTRQQLRSKMYRFDVIHKFTNEGSPKNSESELQSFEACCIEESTIVLSTIIDLSASNIYVGKLKEGLKYLEMIVQFFYTHGYQRLTSADTQRLLNARLNTFIEHWASSPTDQINWKNGMIVDNVIITEAESLFSSNAILLEYMCLKYILKSESIKLEPGLNVLQIDALVYTHFLLFLCYREMQENMKQLKALEGLKKICNHPDIDCPDIAWNLLGYCYMEMHQKERALKSFYRSLREQKRVTDMIQRRPSQATMMFVAILVNKQLIKEWSNIYE